MNFLKKAMLAICILSLICGICGCGTDTHEVKALTKDFENACNKLDMNEMLDCVKPEVAQGVKTLTGIIGMFSDKDTDELLDKFSKVVFNGLPENSQEFFSSIKIRLDNIEKSDDSAFADAEITYEVSGKKKKSNADFEYVCIDGKWYIEDFNIN